MTDQCNFPRCRNLSDLRYIGHEICSMHWEQLCGADSRTEKRLLRKIGLKRSQKGCVMEIEKDEKENQLEKDMG